MTVRTAGFLAAAAGAGAIGVALLFQYVGGLFPCHLCIEQRWAHGIAALLALAAAIAAGASRTRLAAALLGLAGLAFLAGAGIAVFHVGVEQQWWAPTAACTGAGGPPARTIEELRAQLKNAPVARCDEIAWSLAGISMAGYNALFSAGLAVFALAQAARALRRQP